MLVMNSRLWNHYGDQYGLCFGIAGVRTVARARTINESNEHASTSRPSCSLIGMRMACETVPTKSIFNGRGMRGHADDSSSSAVPLVHHVGGRTAIVSGPGWGGSLAALGLKRMKW